MFCKDCPMRSRCYAVCPRLEKELSRIETYQREIPLSPGKIERIIDTATAMAVEDDRPIHKAAMYADLKNALAMLSDRQRKAVELYFFFDLTMTEIAAELDINPSSVHRRIIRALSQLKEMLEV